MNIYEENILDHYKNPRNKGIIKKPTNYHKETNPLCGDEVEFFAIIKNKKIIDLKFNSSGCAISQASASMIAEFAKGKNISLIKKMNKNNVLKMLNVTLTVPRIKCALLPLEVLHKTIGSETKNLKIKKIKS